jgi:hypothetical protein
VDGRGADEQAGCGGGNGARHGVEYSKAGISDRDYGSGVKDQEPGVRD